ncbi:DUF429 domain-containing protein [Kineosporia sp. A_224]|uniref:DUF429 domain-containing protein n=1 Tax=Kineosporia sp. A_224 TaxID=1962180 RepID=UPI000B4BF8CB|nr:DUF429 domain-containing protein [Kineosporia sp. A_224]
MFDIGVDLAWGTTAWTGLAALDESGNLLDARQVRTDDEILDWLRPWTAQAALVAIDAPIVVRNPSGARPCERLISRHFGRFNASCHSANTANPSFAHGTRAERLTTMLALEVDPASTAPRRAVEVYPHPAIVSLFHLPSVITYKDKPGRDLEHLRAELGRLLGLLESLATAPAPLFVAHSPAWHSIRAAVASASTKSQLRAVEDSVDAVVCAYIARYSRHHPEGVRVFGDLASGYILTPVTIEIAAALDAEIGSPAVPSVAAKAPSTIPTVGPSESRVTQPNVPFPEPLMPGRLLVAFDVPERPSSFSSSATTAWVRAVAAQLEARGVQPANTRFAVSIAFRTPQPSTVNEAWDIDNLVKSTLDAMGAILGTRPGRFDPPQADDERVDYLVASKRTVRPGEPYGATIQVYDLHAPQHSRTERG